LKCFFFFFFFSFFPPFFFSFPLFSHAILFSGRLGKDGWGGERRTDGFFELELSDFNDRYEVNDDYFFSNDDTIIILDGYGQTGGTRYGGLGHGWGVLALWLWVLRVC
jgi:hypothetical protein